MGQVLVMILGGLVLAGAGAGIGYWFGAGGRQRGKAEAIQKEFDDYRGRVGSHFSQTAQHFQTIGREYRALYELMASGAEALCDTRSSEGRLSFDPEPVPAQEEAQAQTRDESHDEPRTAADRTRSDEEPGESADAEDAVDESRAASGESSTDDGEAGPDSTSGSGRQENDDSTPDKRARDAGGESAPAEADGEADARHASGNSDERGDGAADVSDVDDADEKTEKTREKTADGGKAAPVGKAETGSERIYH